MYSEYVHFHSGQGATMPHGHSLQRGAPIVGAIGDAAINENGRAMEIAFPSIMGIQLKA
jgi:hypothetical protein